MNKISAISHTTLFFIRTTLFSPHVNPLLLTLIPFALVCAVSRNLDKAGILFCMILFTLTGVLLKPLSLAGEDSAENKTKLHLFYKLLPLDKNVIQISLFFAILIYSFFLYSTFSILLFNSLSLPELQDLTMRYCSESHLSYLHGTYYGPRGLLHHFTETQYPSILFGVLKEREGWPLFPGAMILIPATTCSATIFILMKKIFVPPKRVFISSVTLLMTVTQFILTALFMADLFLPAWSTGEIRRTVTESAENVFSLLLLITTLSLMSGSLFIVKQVMRKKSYV